MWLTFQGATRVLGQIKAWPQQQWLTSLHATCAGKNDAWNGVFGGFAAGAVLGVRAKRMSFGVGSGALLAAASVIVDVTDGKIVGKPLDGMPVRPCQIHPSQLPARSKSSCARQQRHAVCNEPWCRRLLSDFCAIYQLIGTLLVINVDICVSTLCTSLSCPQKRPSCLRCAC